MNNIESAIAEVLNRDNQLNVNDLATHLKNNKGDL